MAQNTIFSKLSWAGKIHLEKENVYKNKNYSKVLLEEQVTPGAFLLLLPFPPPVACTQKER